LTRLGNVVRCRILYDWRLRECDFGARNGSPGAEVKRDRLGFCDRPYPGGESHSQAIERVAGFLTDLPTRWAGRRVMLIGTSRRTGAWST
jgi:broad specificity phosphatase PhoE